MIDVDLLLVWGAAFKKVSPGELVFSEGQVCSFYYQLVSGKVKWLNTDDAGKSIIHKLVGPGESFGEFPLFDDGPYAATAIAVVDSVLIRLHKPVFIDLLKEHSEISLAFARLLSRRLRSKFSIIQSLVSHCPEKMIGTLINQFKVEKKNICDNCNLLKLTRQQIADMTGLRVETVIRAMRNMHEKGELNISKGKVYCRDMIELI
ncbi:MAG: Crp/Fnr family transcriptional regulator [Ferruginibacter sp.]